MTSRSSTRSAARSRTGGDGRRGHPTRRAVLIGTGAVVAGAAAGAAVAVRAPSPASGRPIPPADLVAALAAESDLITALDSLLRAAPTAALQAARADHAAHRDALSSALAAYGPAPTPSPSPSRPPAPASASGWAAVETRAGAAAAARAARLSGPVAALLASIAACEATHAAVLAG